MSIIQQALQAYLELAQHMHDEVCQSYQGDVMLAKQAMAALSQEAEPVVLKNFPFRMFAIVESAYTPPSYITIGKKYEVISVTPAKTMFSIVADDGAQIDCLWTGCPHLKGGGYKREFEGIDHPPKPAPLPQPERIKEQLKSAMGEIRRGGYDKAVNILQELAYSGELLPEPVDECKDCMELIDERDNWEERATALADAVGEYFDVPVGEHSSANCPISEAMKILNGEYVTRLDKPVASVPQDEQAICQCTADESTGWTQWPVCNVCSKIVEGVELSQGAEIQRLTECLQKANIQAEHFEREWYLRGDEIEKLKSTTQDVEEFIAANREVLPCAFSMDGPPFRGVSEKSIRTWMAGHARVPVEPTRKMCLAATSYTHSHDAKLIYKAMIAASQQEGV